MAKIYYNDNGTWKVVDVPGGGSGGSIDPTSTVTAYGFHATGAEGQMYIYPDNIQYWDTASNQYMYFFPTKSGVNSYTFLTDANVKTLFGDKNIVGSGNIDLYRHIIKFGTKSAEYPSGIYAYAVVISSKNLIVDSITDLKTLLGNTFEYPLMGICSKNSTSEATTFVATKVTESNLYFWSPNSEIDTPISLAGVTISDTVTTV